MCNIEDNEHSYFRKRIFNELKYYLNDNNLNSLEVEQDKSTMEEAGINILQNEEIVESDKNDADELLIDLVQGYPCIYNSSLQEFKDKGYKESAWEEISMTMNMKPEAAMKRWDNLRDRYTKEKRIQIAETKSGSGLSRRQKFCFYQRMAFIDPFIRKRNSISNFVGRRLYSDLGDSSNDEMKDENSKNNAPMSPSSNSPKASMAKKIKIKKEVDLNCIEHSLLSLTQTVQQNLNERKFHSNDRTTDDEKDAPFFSFLKCQMKSLTDKRKIQLQAEISSLICKAIADDTTEQTK